MSYENWKHILGIFSFQNSEPIWYMRLNNRFQFFWKYM